MSGSGAIEPLSEELLRYGIEMAPVYRRLRRLVGQLGGIAILAQAGQSAPWPDHPALAAAGEALREAEETIRRASVPAEQHASHAHLRRSAADLAWVVSRLRKPPIAEAHDRTWPGTVAIALDRAYRALKWASNEALGFSLVDARQSCCCSAHAPAGTHHPPA